MNITNPSTSLRTIPWDCAAAVAAAAAAGDTIERPEFDSMQKSRRLRIILYIGERETERDRLSG